MKNKLTSLQQIYDRCIEQDRKVGTCIISPGITNETLYVMYNVVKETQLLASVGKCIGALHLSLQHLINPQQRCITENSDGGNHYPWIINCVRTLRS